MARLLRRASALLGGMLLLALGLSALPANAATGSWSTYSYTVPPYYCSGPPREYYNSTIGYRDVDWTPCTIVSGNYYQATTRVENWGEPSLVLSVGTERYKAGAGLEGTWLCAGVSLANGADRACFTATALGVPGDYVQGRSDIGIKVGSGYYFQTSLPNLMWAPTRQL